MQRGRQRKYSWEEDSRFQPANDDHDEEWPRAEPARVVRRSAPKKARRQRKSPFLAALQGASVAIFVVAALGVGAMFALGISPGDLGFASDEAPAVETAAVDTQPPAPQRKDIAAITGDAFATQPNSEPIRQPVAVAAVQDPEPMPEPAVQPAVEKISTPAPVVEAPPAPAERVAAVPPPAAPVEKIKISSGELTKLLNRAEDAIKQGDVSSARLLLGRAAKAEDPAAVLLLAQTYDPNMLQSWGNRGVKPDPEKARALYKKAEKLGATEATTLLSGLE